MLNSYLGNLEFHITNLLYHVTFFAKIEFSKIELIARSYLPIVFNNHEKSSILTLIRSTNYKRNAPTKTCSHFLP